MIRTTEKKKETTDLVPVKEMALVSPVALESVLASFRAFERMKKELLTDADWMRIGDREFILKSGWLKIALAYNLSLKKMEERIERNGDVTVWNYTYRAIFLPSGRFADADGSASSDERKFSKMPHDCRALAQTRACNRAIANLVGGGQVSFEEMDSDPRPAPKNTPEPAEVSALDEVILKAEWTWNKIFEDFGPRIAARQDELGPLFSFEKAAVIFAREQLLVES